MSYSTGSADWLVFTSVMVEQAPSVLGTLNRGLNQQGSPEAGQGLSSRRYSEHRARWTEGLGQALGSGQKIQSEID